MSDSPPVRRLSTASSSSKREENLINAYEAEEERIINVLSRKLEQACSLFHSCQLILTICDGAASGGKNRLGECTGGRVGIACE